MDWKIILMLPGLPFLFVLMIFRKILGIESPEGFAGLAEFQGLLIISSFIGWAMIIGIAILVFC